MGWEANQYVSILDLNVKQQVSFVRYQRSSDTKSDDNVTKTTEVKSESQLIYQEDLVQQVQESEDRVTGM